LDLRFPFRRTRPPRIDRSVRARRIRLGTGALALALAAGAAAAETPRALVAAGKTELAQLLAPPPRRRAAVYTSAGVGLACVPIALLALRRRRRERERERMVREQCARVPEVFEAARVTRPLRRSPPFEHREPDGLPPLGPVSPEVASRAAALRAAAVREAAARATLLRTASERSETRRRAAALRARARRDQRVDSVALAALEAGPDAKPTPPPPLALPAIALPAPRSAEPAIAPEPSASAAAPVAPEAPPTPPAPPEPALAVGRGTGRVAILRGSGPLTFEWLERCLARDPEDIQARLDLCTALLVAERFADAERVAREGLERDATDGRLLLRLSEALSGLERSDEALEAAVRAVRTHRSRKAVLHLTRLSALGHRFAPGDGPRLRKALENRPHDPVFLHALGVFEALHGSPREALQWLRLALRQERTPRWRRAVSREIARLRAAEISGTPAPRRAAG
jgi:tetratricopeptide (TPR) repeat protein